jgi:hypothetical protein
VDSTLAAGDNGCVNRQRLWLLPLLLAVMVFGGWYFGARAQGEDRELPVYVTGGERMAAGEEIYRRGTDAKPFTYPPFAAVPFVPFALLPLAWQPPAWFVVNFVILVFLARWLHAWGRRDWPGAGPPRLLWFWGLTLVLGVHHVLSVLTNQSHDLFIAGALGLAAASWCRKGHWAGLWAGLGGAIKATPMLCLGLFALRLRPLAVVLLLGSFAALSLLPDWWFPRDDGKYWLQAWYEVNLRGLEVGGTADARGAWNPHSYLNQSLSGTLTRLLTAVSIPGRFVDEQVALANLSPGAAKNVGLALQLGVLALIAGGIRGAARAVRAAPDPLVEQRRLGLGEVAAIACGMVLLSPQSSKAHFCVWIFPAAFLADRLLRGRRDLLLWLLVGMALLLGPLASKGLVGRDLGNKLLAYGNVTWCTVLLLLATVRSLRPTALPLAPAGPPS